INFINSSTTGGGSGEGEGEGESNMDLWVPATSLSLPVPSSSNPSNLRVESSSDLPVGKTTNLGLDDYLASLPSEVGPSMAAEELEWLSTWVDEEESEDSKAISGILGEVLDEFV
ncbi:MAG: hypothetical protein KGQ60_10685, partial [Planctomycetes bacterium]|nr:hypothetical protein [Planctomycetota bacterium]